MTAFAVYVTVLLLYFTLHNTLIVSPAPLSTGNLTKILEILNQKLGVVKKNHTVADEPLQSSLTDTEKNTMDMLMNRLYKRVIDDGSGADRAVDSSDVVGVVEKAAQGEKESARVSSTTVAASAASAMAAAPTTRNLIGDRATAAAAAVRSPAAKDAAAAAVRSPAAKDAAAAAPRSPDPLLVRFARLPELLDRPDDGGVDEAVATMVEIPAFLNKSDALDEPCPFDRMVDDDEQLVARIVQRLRRLHEPPRDRGYRTFAVV